ncbi:LysR family transcriptional regulator [Siculibacillus lacustris]|uniref:LysR family transcriptional regulator n=1 Tax=Siculibacillus lacustris TaxID=1549641 RepID=A0A4Q9VTN1_9HYPH|nr:LysR family transcriptional regulator [Siculibacillus lacustris]TBW39449.1 LysR family transcriptional regulator [Siculibacillus lacustris]
MRVTLAQLEAFFWTVQLGSAGRAAQHLAISQPTMSLRLKDLAEAVGCELFERNGRGLRVTADGRALLPRVEAIMAELRQISGRDPHLDVAGAVRIGLAEGFAVTCLSPLLTALQEDYPTMQPEWVVSTSTTLESALMRDALDLAVLLNPVGDDRMRLTPLGAQPTSWVAPATWAFGRAVTPKDLQDLPVISNPQPSAMHRQITGWFATAGLEPARLSLCTSVAVIAELVAGGIGAGLLPVRMVERHVAAGTMQYLVTNPTVLNGRLYVGVRTGVDDPKTRAVARTIGRVLQSIDYLQT